MSTVHCPTCGEPMTFDDERVTLIGFGPSPPGHDHDDNDRRRYYHCPNGHTHVISKRNRCPACDWVGEKYDLNYDGPKVDKWPEEET